MPTRPSPIPDLLTSESQHAYKRNKSTTDILALVKKVHKNDGAPKNNALRSPKAVGDIERDILWAKMYKAGIPFNFIRTIRMGHEGNRLIPKCDGYIRKSGNNNKGVSQGSPPGATLFIIYDGQTIQQYHAILREHIQRSLHTMKIKSRSNEYAWAKYLYQIPNKSSPAEVIKQPYQSGE